MKNNNFKDNNTLGEFVIDVETITQILDFNEAEIRQVCNELNCQYDDVIISKKDFLTLVDVAYDSNSHREQLRNFLK